MKEKRLMQGQVLKRPDCAVLISGFRDGERMGLLLKFIITEAWNQGFSLRSTGPDLDTSLLRSMMSGAYMKRLLQTEAIAQARSSHLRQKPGRK